MKENKKTDLMDLRNFVDYNKKIKQDDETFKKLMFIYKMAIKELKNMGFTKMIVGCLAANPTNEFYKHMGGKLIEVATRKIKGHYMTENIYYYENLKDIIKN